MYQMCSIIASLQLLLLASCSRCHLSESGSPPHPSGLVLVCGSGRSLSFSFLTLKKIHTFIITRPWTQNAMHPETSFVLDWCWLVMVMGTDIPGGYAGKGTASTDKDTYFGIRGCTHTRVPVIPIPTMPGLVLPNNRDNCDPCNSNSDNNVTIMVGFFYISFFPY